MRLNAQKTHEMTISFAKNPPKFEPVKIENTAVESVKSAKLVGVTIQEDLKWDENTDTILKKAQKRPYFMKKLKSSGASSRDLKQFYASIVRPVGEYAAPAWATSITKQQRQKLEMIQKRAIHIILPTINYEDGLDMLQLETLETRRDQLCRIFFSKIKNEKDKIHDVLPEVQSLKYNLRKQNEYPNPKCRTNRYKNSFVPYTIKNF